jgi:excisionase family DNA binding protein
VSPPTRPRHAIVATRKPRRRCNEAPNESRQLSHEAATRPGTAAPRRLTADDVMTGREVALLLHMPVSTVEDLARRGDLPSVKIGRRRLYIRQNIEAVLMGHRAASSDSDRPRIARHAY